MGACKTKNIQADLGIFTYIPAYSDIFRHNKAYSEIIQAYSKIADKINKTISRNQAKVDRMSSFDICFFVIFDY